jgi:hypothetical protein
MAKVVVVSWRRRFKVVVRVAVWGFLYGLFRVVNVDRE